MYENLKKKYGQNFLIDNNILNKISALIGLKHQKILEIGPGSGKLTDEILSKEPDQLTLVEIDRELIDILKKKYAQCENINIINENILDLTISQKFQTVISNLPYNISSQILVKLSVLDNAPDRLILMFQKEFAKRLLNKKINSINSLVRCFYEIKLNFNVSRNCFRPIPKVDSSVLTFVKKNKNLIEKNEISNFINFKRKLFSYKRKSLKNLLKGYDLEKKFDLSLRVEDLELSTLIKIFRNVNV
jgi:16S rRNA (adenine1518-N6/adenine1519-N6)-dimethyltransferase